MTDPETPPATFPPLNTFATETEAREAGYADAERAFAEFGATLHVPQLVLLTRLLSKLTFSGFTSLEMARAYAEGIQKSIDEEFERESEKTKALLGRPDAGDGA